MSPGIIISCSPRDKMDYSFLLRVALIYLIIQGLGLVVGSDLIKKIEREEIPPAVENPESPVSSVQIFIYIIVMALIMLLLLKYNLDLIIKIFFSIALFIGLSLTFYTLLGGIGLLPAVLLLLAGIRRKDPATTNIVLTFTIPGIGGLLGASLAVIPSLLLLIFLSIYDIIAVFGTKHMITLADGVKGKIPMMIAIPFENRYLGLGTGDLAIPVLFSVSVLRDYSLAHSILTVLGGSLALILLFMHIMKKKEHALPALPPLALGLILGFLAGFLL